VRARTLLPVSLCAAALALPSARASAESAAAVPVRPPGEAGRPVRLLIDAPAPGSRVESELHMAEVRGTAVAAGGQPAAWDVMVVLDTSQSTRAASGADVDGDGDVGENPQLGLYAPGEFPEDVLSTDPGDTILHAEVHAARALLGSLDPRRARVGLVTFSGEVDPATGERAGPEQRDARLEVPLSGDFTAVARALDQVAAREPSGATNFAAGIRVATIELAGFADARSAPRPDARKVMLFLTDGIPSFPVGRADVSDPGDLEAAANAARVAHSAGIRINSYALGPEALAKPKAATEIARLTLGTFTPVLEPGAIVAALQAVSFANVEDVGVVNLTTRESAPDVRLNPDGSFVAFVPVREGRNRVLVNALASDGSEANVELDFEFLVADSGDARMRAEELARLRRINDELIRHVEAERVRRERREKRMERELDIRAVQPE
jgi:hypothetical protein